MKVKDFITRGMDKNFNQIKWCVKKRKLKEYNLKESDLLNVEVKK